MLLGHVDSITLKQALDETKLMMADVTRGIDVAAERQNRKREATAKHAEAKNRLTMASLADEFLNTEQILRRKGAKVIRQRFENDIIATLGKMDPKDVTPRDIGELLTGIVKRGSPTMVIPPEKPGCS